MSAARPLTSLLSAGAVVALTLAAPGTALADPGSGAGGGKSGGEHAAGHPGDEDAGRSKGEAGQPDPGRDGDQGAAAGSAEPAPSAPAEGAGGPGEGAPAKGGQDTAQPGQGQSQGKAGQGKGAPGKGGQGKGASSQGAPAKGGPGKGAPAQDAPAQAPAPAPNPGDQQPAPAAPADPGDPAGNNGTIKIDTVPGDADRANRPHPGCAFVVQFFNFDAGQTADITFTGQAPTRSAGPLLSLSGRTISTTPADGALEEGHSLTLTAADLGLVGTPTAAKGWHVKVAVDALEAPGGAKQKVFWLDCSADAATVTQEPDDVAAEQDAAEAETEAAVVGVVGATGKDAAVRSVQLEQPGTGRADGVAVLSESATREAAGPAERGAGGVSGEASAATGEVGAAARPADDQRSATRASALPFTGPAGLAAMLAAGLGAVGAGVLALRAGRRRTAAASSDLTG